MPLRYTDSDKVRLRIKLAQGGDPRTLSQGLDWAGLDWTGLDWTGVEGAEVRCHGN